MNMLTWFVFAAMIATVVSLGSGLIAMVTDGEVRHYGSAHWMSWRVGFQAAAVALILLALLGTR